jgi:C2H2-type zinc finger
LGTQLTDQDLEELAARAPAGATSPAGAGELECPECGRTFSSQASLNGHLAAHRGGAKGRTKAQASRERPKGKHTTPDKPVGLEGSARSVVNKAVANTQGVGALLASIPFTAHVGLTIAGYIDPDTKQVRVASRAAMAGDILIGHLAAAQTPDEIQRAAQIVELLRRYNSIFEGGELFNVGASLAVAAAVDARVIPPDFGVKLGPMEVPVVALTIGDVVAELDRQGLYEQQAPAGPGETPPPTYPGDVEEIVGDVTAT